MISRLTPTGALMEKHDNGMCDERDVLETAEHVIFKCSKYDDQLNNLFSNIRNRPVSIVDLLGKGLSDNQIYKEVLTFLEVRPQDLGL